MKNLLRVILGLAAAALLATACAAPSTVAASQAPSKHQTPVDKAVAAECVAFTKVSSDIQAKTATASDGHQIAVALQRHGAEWGKTLGTAAKNIPGRFGVPLGANRARSLAVRIAATGLAVANAALAADLGRATITEKNWTRATGYLTRVTRACA